MSETVLDLSKEQGGTEKILRSFTNKSESPSFAFHKSFRGQDQLWLNNNVYNKKKINKSGHTIWRCVAYWTKKCPSIAVTSNGKLISCTPHKHDVDDKSQSIAKETDIVTESYPSRETSLEKSYPEKDDDYSYNTTDSQSSTFESSQMTCLTDAENIKYGDNLFQSYPSSKISSEIDALDNDDVYVYNATEYQPSRFVSYQDNIKDSDCSIDSFDMYNLGSEPKELPIQRKYVRINKPYSRFENWDDPNKLVDRLRVIVSCGDTSHYQEIDFIINELRLAYIKIYHR